MTKLWNNVWVLGAMVVGLGMSGLVLGATGAGPYYATPAWDQKLDCSTTAACPRFVVLTNWNGEAVLDRETGLVWEQSPSTSTLNWFSASDHCVQLSKGGRKGWRLPTIHDLASLIDPTQSFPSLPFGHPFGILVQSSYYWSSTTTATSDAGAWLVGFFGNGVVVSDGKSDEYYAWCVRGGPGG